MRELAARRAPLPATPDAGDGEEADAIGECGFAMGKVYTLDESTARKMKDAMRNGHFVDLTEDPEGPPSSMAIFHASAGVSSLLGAYESS